MTTPVPLARIPRRLPPNGTSSTLVVALLLLFSGKQALADTGIPLSSASPTRASTIDSTVTAVNGTVLDVVGGQMRIDVADAIITNGDGPDVGPLPSTAIPVGARVVAEVTVLSVLPPTSFPPPPFPATSVIVYLPRDGRLAGTIEGVDVASGTFGMFYRGISTSTATVWSGYGPNGPVKGIGDLAAGMFASVAVVVSDGGLLAVSVDAVGLVNPPHIIAFHGPVQSIASTQWRIADHVVQVNAATKIVGDPKVGDTVDVVAETPWTPPGSEILTPIPVAISIIRSPIIDPPGPISGASEFDGTVQSIPVEASALAPPLGHWTISSRDVFVNGLTKLDSGIHVGSSVHVKGSFVVASANGSNVFAAQFVATSITKND